MATTTPTTTSPDTEQHVRPGRTHRIGVIVAGSLAAGLVAAAVLVLGVFGGASENVIAASALLGFALGWGMLWRLSARRTDQPQRWAAVPAVAMALTGRPAARLARRRRDRGVRLGVAAGRARPGRVDGCRLPAAAPQQDPALAAVPAVRRHRRRRGRRHLRERPRGPRPQRLRDDRPAGRRRWAQAPHQLHRHRQPDGRPRGRLRRNLSDVGLGRPGGRPAHPGLRVRPRRPRLERVRRPAGRRRHRHRSAHAARPRR